MSRILTLNGITVEPTFEGPGFTTSGYVVLGAIGSLVARQREELASLGIEILEYAVQDAYLCACGRADLDPIRALPYVAWIGAYDAAFKISPALLAEPPGGPRRVDVVFHRNVDPWAILPEIANAAGVDPDTLVMSRGKVRLSLPRRRLAELAKVDGVRHIEPVAPRSLHCAAATVVTEAAPHQAEPRPRALEGHGEIVAVCDTGLDRGSVTKGELHPAFAGRVARLYPLGRLTASDPHGHGTHVCGALLGDGVYMPGGGATSMRLRGAAPGATLIVQSVQDSLGGLGGIPSDLHDLFGPPYHCDGARIHSNSWGDDESSSGGRYTQSCRELDEFVWMHRDMVIVASAGNEPGSVRAPSTSKNCIAVGATERHGTGEGRSAAATSRGPNDRTKPDVVAPGTLILSARSRARDAAKGLTNDPNYVCDGGASMATPLVSGCVALIRQSLRRASGAGYSPSAALLKALLIDGARGHGSEPHPGLVAGFGRVDVASTLATLHESMSYWDEGIALDSGEEASFFMMLPEPIAGMKITLAWTDFPGEVLQNDLDLIVAAGDAVWHGNMPAGSTEFDRTNNVEQVVLGALPAGKVDLTVRAHRVTIGPQPFALVARAL